MNSIIANALFSLYYDGFIDSFFNTLSGVLGAVNEVLSQNFIATCFNTMSGIAASLIIIYFYIDIVDLVTRELFSLEKLISLFIRMFVCVAVCACMQQLCTVLVGLTDQFLKFVNETFKDAIEQSRIVMLIPGNEDDFVEAMDNVFTGGAINAEARFIRKLGNLVSQIGFTLSHPLWSIEAFIIIILSGIIKIVGYFIAISTSIMLIVRFIFAPIGIVNMFRDDTSSGMRYFKSLIATACSFGAMLAIVGAATLITGPLMESGVFKTLGLEGDYNDDDSLEDDDENDDSSDNGILLTIDFGYVDENGEYQYADYVSKELVDTIIATPDSINDTITQAASLLNNTKKKDVDSAFFKNEPNYSCFKDIWNNNYEEIRNVQGISDNGDINWPAIKDGINDYGEDDHIYFPDYDATMNAIGDKTNLYKNMYDFFNQYIYNTTGTTIDVVAGDSVPDLDNLTPVEEDLALLKIEEIYSSQIDIALNFRTVIAALVPQLAAIGGMAGATRIIRDALGV